MEEVYRLEKQNGRAVSIVWWDGENTQYREVQEEDNIELIFYSEYFGDHSENFIIEIDKETKQEIARYNVRSVSGWKWKD